MGASAELHSAWPARYYDGFDPAIGDAKVEAFAQESNAKGKSNGRVPASLEEAVGLASESRAPLLAILSLVNESQCEQVCFSQARERESLIQLLPEGSSVVLTSTVTGTSYTCIQKVPQKKQLTKSSFCSFCISSQRRGPNRRPIAFVPKESTWWIAPSRGDRLGRDWET